MPTVSVITSTGDRSASLQLSDAVFAAPINKVVIREALNNYMANQRQGTHKTKGRGEVAGSNRKPFRQKHTGRARQGSWKAPQHRGGGTQFGPQPRDYSYKLGRRKKRLAITGMLSNLLAAERLHVVDSVPLAAPKTKDLVKFISQLGVTGKVLLLVDTADKNVLLAARNVKARNSKSAADRPVSEIIAAPFNNINIYDLLVCDCMVATVPAVQKLQEMLQ
ncbi:MAG: 50S ribosomal protein L4 [Candidatus Sumerlaeia bacterium]